MNFCLDTDVAIELIRARRPQYRERFEEALLGGGFFHLSAISLHELTFGARVSARPDHQLELLSRFASSLAVVDWSLGDAMEAAEIRAHLKALGKPIGDMDVLIAGQARARGWTLVTANVREFARVPGLPILDWSDPAGARAYPA